jgi:hypothetical protein
VIGRVWCRHSPVVWLHDEYPYDFRFHTSYSYARMPAWGKPYMPLLISTNTCPLCTYFNRAYCSIIYCGIAERGMRMYLRL